MSISAKCHAGLRNVTDTVSCWRPPPSGSTTGACVRPLSYPVETGVLSTQACESAGPLSMRVIWTLESAGTSPVASSIGNVGGVPDHLQVGDALSRRMCVPGIVGAAGPLLMISPRQARVPLNVPSAVESTDPG